MIKVINIDELRDDEVYDEILEDMRDEGMKFGMCICFLFADASMLMCSLSF